MENENMRKAINPFDDDFEGESEEVFHDSLQEVPRHRVAPLNFDNPFDQVEDPALTFDPSPRHASTFVSPLESALMSDVDSPAKNTGYSTFWSYRNAALASGKQDDNDLNDEITEGSALLSRKAYTQPSPGRNPIPTEIDTSVAPTPARRRTSAMGKRGSLATVKQKIVLKELASGESEFTMDYKYILLEDLGTASSWLILLLPYVAFFLALLLESSKGLKVVTLGPLTANQSCPTPYKEDKALSSVPLMSCYASFHDRMVDRGKKMDSMAGNVNNTYSGVMFDSGALPPIPVLSTDLNGDLVFDGISSNAVALVSNGLVEFSVLVLQEASIGDADWLPMFASAPKMLNMACLEQNDGLWYCKTPRLVDVVFSMPDSAVYGGGELRVNIFFSLRDAGGGSDDTPALSVTEETILFINQKSDESALKSTDITDRQHLLTELVSSSVYTFEHMSPLAMKVDTAMRLSTFLASLCFVIYWCKSMQISLICSCAARKKGNILWWESPWVLFPERWYIIVLLVSLLLLQEPVLAVMSFVPDLGGSTRIHIAADATIGIGVQGVLFVYLCLFRGLPFHTAAVTKRRTEHQRRMLELRRAAKYVATSGHPASPTDDGVSDYIIDYFDRFGDVDGSASSAFLLLPNDPCSDGWVDFLFLKLFLLLVGIASVVGTAYCRFPPTDPNAEMTEYMIHRLKWAYIFCIVVQFSTLIVWMFLILVASVDAGTKLRHEPFLSTRPVQLAYRVLLAHVSLGITVLVVPIATNFSQIMNKWTLNGSSGHVGTTSNDESSRLEIAIRALSGIARHFPYSGTAASVGSGKVLFATVSILITAFIFLPAHILDEDDDEKHNGVSRTVLNEKLHEQRRLRRDKRLVVNLAKHSKTWRVFPLPIKQSAVSTTTLQDDAFQLYSDMHTDGSTRERGIVSVGPYTPVFCLELACWLNEASWQAYYAPDGITPNDPNVTSMNLEGLGLRLEGAIYDASTDTQAYVATNVADQVDGNEDSIIVVAFRGSASTTNLQTDLKSRQVPLLDQLAGIGAAPFSILPDEVVVCDDDGWIWETPAPVVRESLQCVTSWTSPKAGCKASRASREQEPSKLSAVSEGARKILQATPVARSSFPLVHEGFQEAYTQIRKELLHILFPVLQRQFASALEIGHGTDGTREPLALPKVYCTGHSLGGSLAQLLALDLANNCEFVVPTRLNDNLESFYDAEDGGRPMGMSIDRVHNLRLQPPIAVYTFGQPRVGNKTFSRLYKQRVPHTFRVVNEGDAITAMPNYLCGGIYKHSGLEVLLDEGQTGNILVGPNVVETLFRFGKVRTSVMAHTMQRYRDCLECAFAQDELLEYYRGHNLVTKGTNITNEGVVEPGDLPDWLTRKESEQRLDMHDIRFP